MATSTQFDTVSERFFAEYLCAEEYDWERHPSIQGQTKTSDFRFLHSGISILCDVKERTPSNVQLDEQRIKVACFEDMSYGNGVQECHAVKHVRHLIEEGRCKFKTFDNYLCVLVVYNNGHSEAQFDPLFIYWGMLGNLAVRVEANAIGIADRDTLRCGFGPRGSTVLRKLNPLTLSKSMKNISAIAVLESRRIPNPDFTFARDLEIRDRIAQLGRPLSGIELSKIFAGLTIGGIEPTVGETWGVTVCTNPCASIPFPEDLFTGAFDTHWSIKNNEMTRVFVGAQRQAFDQLVDGNYG